VRRQPGDIPAIEQHPTAIGFVKACQDVEQRRLARAIGTDQTGDGASAHLKRAVVQDEQAAKRFDEVTHFEDSAHNQ
jgi:hypothetical protein